MRFVRAAGNTLDAAFDLEPDWEGVQIVLHSRQGSERSKNKRNVDYYVALESILRGVAQVGGRITSISVDSSVARKLPESERLVCLEYPIVLYPHTDFASLRRSITEGQRIVASRGTSSGHRGNSHKRIRISVALSRVPEDLHRLGAALGWIETPKLTAFASYRQAIPEPSLEAPDPFTTDVEAHARGLLAHATTQNLLADHLQAIGLIPVSPGAEDPNFDVAWFSSARLYVAEVKSLAGTSPTTQLRLGLGQVLHYRAQLGLRYPDVIPVLAVDRQPDPIWQVTCSSSSVILTWPPHWPRLNCLSVES